jgi:signal transduction histidine kinase
MNDNLSTLNACVNAVGRIEGMTTWLDVVRDAAGMRVAFIAAVMDDASVVCSVLDDLGLGIEPGNALDANGALRLEPAGSQLAVPIVLAGGRLFGMLCALDINAGIVAEPRIMAVFKRIAALIAHQLDQQTWRLQKQSRTPNSSGVDAIGQSRERFIAILAHDLRNPLHAVFANGDLLERKIADPALAAAASRIKTNVRRMSSLIDDLLDFARSHLGRGIGLELTDEQNVQARLNEVVQEFQDAQPHRKIIAHISIGRPVRCDIRRVQQVVSNLLGNALTHGRASSPITITALADTQDLVLQVWNAGEPIPAENLETIFEPFSRPAGGNSHEGLGLGLHICAAIVRAHEGRISVTSTKAEGTEITARFPLGMAGIQLHDAFQTVDTPSRGANAVA